MDVIESERVIAEARRWIGTPYRHQASCCGAGSDCLGLVRGIYRALYGREPDDMPPYARYARHGDPEILADAAPQYLVAMDEPAPGHVLLFRLRRGMPARHLAVMSAPDRMIHAATGLHVCEVHITDWWRARLVGRFAFPAMS